MLSTLRLGKLNLEEGDWEKFKSCKLADSEPGVFRFKKTSQIEPGFADRSSSDVNGKEVLDDISRGSSTTPPDAEKDGASFILDKMKSVYMIHDANLRDPLDAHKDVEDDTLEGNVDLVIMDPPHSMKSKRGMANILHDIFKPEDISDFVDLVLQTMDIGVRRNVF